MFTTATGCDVNQLARLVHQDSTPHAVWHDERLATSDLHSPVAVLAFEQDMDPSGGSIERSEPEPYVWGPPTRWCHAPRHPPVALAFLAVASAASAASAARSCTS